MPIRFRINKKTRLITVIVEGRITAEDAVSYIHEQQADPETSDLARLVLISARVETVTLSEINNLARVVDDLCPADGNQCAIVTFTDVHFGQSRMYLSYRNSSADKLRVFRDIREALVWLGVDSNPAIMEFEMAIAMS